MTENHPTGNQPDGNNDTDPADGATEAQLAASALVRLCIRQEDARLSVDLLTDEADRLDVNVIQELVYLAAGLVQALAELLGVDPEALLDDHVRHIVGETDE